MRLKKVFISLMLFLSISVCFAHTDAKKVMMAGNVIYGVGNNIFQIDLGKLIISKLYSKPRTTITQLAKINSGNLLFTQDSNIGYVITLFNRNSKNVKILRRGISPLYMSKYRELLFYYTPSYKEGEWLYRADINAPIKSAKKITSVKLPREIIIPVSDDMVIFNREENHPRNNSVWSYNLHTSVLKKLPIKHCTFPQIWRSKTEQLICYDGGKKRYFLTDLQGRRNEVLPFKKGVTPILYIPKYDKLLLNITTLYVSKTCMQKCDPTPRPDGTNRCMFCGAEIYNLGIYDFKTKEIKLIKRNHSFDVGDGVYYPD